MKPRLFIVCGLPGSGKTTFAKRMEERFQAVRFCPDEWLADLALDAYDQARREKVEALQWKLAQGLLERGLSVVIEWGTWGRAERDRLRVRARELGAAVELDYLTAPFDVLCERVRQRGMEHPAIQREDMLGWAQMFQVPTAEELALFDPPL
jgi:predicted kinase